MAQIYPFIVESQPIILGPFECSVSSSSPLSHYIAHVKQGTLPLFVPPLALFMGKVLSEKQNVMS